MSKQDIEQHRTIRALRAWYTSCLHKARQIVVTLLDRRKPACTTSLQSDEISDGAICPPESCGIAVEDDQLFDSLQKQKKRRKRRIVRTVIIVIAVIVLAIVAAVLILRQRVNEQFAQSGDEVLSYAATVGTINTTVSGSGTLSDVDLTGITVPSGVEIDEIVVTANNKVQEGDILATVNITSVLNALSELQVSLDELDEQLDEAREDAVDKKLTTGASGRVKQIFAQEGDSVTGCMTANGALAVLSLDGYMAVSIETDRLATQDEVMVRLADGTEYEGTVYSTSGAQAVILLTDNGPCVDDEATVLLGDIELGTGSLYIHNPLRITGFAGVVNDVRVNENAWVYSGNTLFILEDTEYSANYEAILQQRQEKEEELLQLLEIYGDGAVCSPISGSVSSIDYTEDVDSSTAAQSSYGVSTTQSDEKVSVVTISADEQMSVTIFVDEADILSLALGQIAEVSVDSISTESLSGIVTEINKTAVSSSGVTQYSAVVTIDKMERMLPGMSADVDIAIEGVENAVLIPSDALNQTSTSTFVYTSYNSETGEYGGVVEVTPGLSNSNYVEIISGLSEGDIVYYTEAAPAAFDWSSMGGMGGFSGDFGSGRQN